MPSLFETKTAEELSSFSLSPFGFPTIPMSLGRAVLPSEYQGLRDYHQILATEADLSQDVGGPYEAHRLGRMHPVQRSYGTLELA